MPGVIDRMTGALYRVGLHHPSGESSLVSLATRPARFTIGEAAASLADALAARYPVDRGQ